MALQLLKLETAELKVGQPERWSAGRPSAPVPAYGANVCRPGRPHGSGSRNRILAVSLVSMRHKLSGKQYIERQRLFETIAFGPFWGVRVNTGSSHVSANLQHLSRVILFGCTP